MVVQTCILPCISGTEINGDIHHHIYLITLEIYTHTKLFKVNKQE